MRSRPRRLLVLLVFALVPAMRSHAQVIAILDGQPITAADIDKQTATQLLPLRLQEFDIKANAVKTLAFARLQQAEAKRRGISVEELYKREVTDRVAQPTEDKVKEALQALATQLPSDPAEARKVIIEALQQPAIEEREAQFKNELFAKAHFELKLIPPRAHINIAGTDPVRGAASAPITIVEFSDFECPYCGRSEEVLRAMRKQYGDRIRVIYKQFPLEQTHDHARLAAEASLCANDQKKFWELHDWMFENVQKLNRDDLVAAAKTLGLAPEPFAKCIDDHLHAKDVDSDVATGQDAGVAGTPAFFVNGRMVTGSVSASAFSEVIDDELRVFDSRKPSAVKN